MTNELAPTTEILHTIYGDEIHASIARIPGRYGPVGVGPSYSVIFKDSETGELVSEAARLFKTDEAAVAYAVDQLGLVLADFVDRRNASCSSGETDVYTCSQCQGDSDPEPDLDDAGRRTVRHEPGCYVASL